MSLRTEAVVSHAVIRMANFSATRSLSEFVPLRNTYLNTHESIRGQGEARKIPLLNVSLARLRFKAHPPQQVLEARVVAGSAEVATYQEQVNGWCRRAYS